MIREGKANLRRRKIAVLYFPILFTLSSKFIPSRHIRHSGASRYGVHTFFPVFSPQIATIGN